MKQLLGQNAFVGGEGSRQPVNGHILAAHGEILAAVVQHLHAGAVDVPKEPGKAHLSQGLLVVSRDLVGEVAPRQLPAERKKRLRIRSAAVHHVSRHRHDVGIF